MLCVQPDGLFRASAQTSFDTIAAITVKQTLLHVAPGRQMASVSEIEAQTRVVVEGRNAVGHWALIQVAASHQRGWVESSSLTLANSITLHDLPIIPETYVALQLQLAAMPLASEASSSTIIQRLSATPVLFNMDTDELRTIFQHGQQLGNRADVFTKIGDSNTTSMDYLRPFGLDPAYCQLGAYSYLQPTIDFFSTPASQGEGNSFTRYSWAAFKGMSSSAAVDPMWAPGDCRAGETPVECEYRLSQASTAIVMLGLMDVRYSTEETYYQNMESVVQISLDKGVIPVLTTLTVLPNQAVLDYDTMLVVNGAMLDLAEKYQIPLINLWLALQALEDYGIGPDRTHLKHKVTKYCSFDGTENEIGGTLRNLLSLQALDEIRRNVLVGH